MEPPGPSDIASSSSSLAMAPVIRPVGAVPTESGSRGAGAGSSSRSGAFVRPETAADWEPYKSAITELYKTLKLRDVMIQMETGHAFKATVKQYKNKIREWGLDTKYVKGEEYRAMLKHQRIRYPKKTAFKLRGQHVDLAKLSRFERREISKKKLTMEDKLDDAETPEDLECFTPPMPGTPERGRFIAELPNKGVAHPSYRPPTAIPMAQQVVPLMTPPALPVYNIPYAPFTWWPHFVEYATGPDGSLGMGVGTDTPGLAAARMPIHDPLSICNALAYDDSLKDFGQLLTVFATPMANYEQRHNYQDAVMRARTIVYTAEGCARFCALDSLRGLLWFLWNNVDTSSHGDQLNMKNFLRALVYEMLKGGRGKLNIHFLMHFAVCIAGEMGLQHFLLGQAVSGWEESLKALQMCLGRSPSDDLRLHWAMLLMSRSYVLTLRGDQALEILSDPELEQYKSSQPCPIYACENAVSALLNDPSSLLRMLTSLHPDKTERFLGMSPSDEYHFLRNTVFYNELLTRARRESLQGSVNKF